MPKEGFTTNKEWAKGQVINYGEGGGSLQNGKIAGPKPFAPLLKTGIELFAPPPF